MALLSKKVMGFLYGMGAAVVIVGALFKLQHWTGADIMLIIGLLTEAAIFALSAFEILLSLKVLIASSTSSAMKVFGSELYAKAFVLIRTNITNTNAVRINFFIILITC